MDRQSFIGSMRPGDKPRARTPCHTGTEYFPWIVKIRNDQIKIREPCGNLSRPRTVHDKKTAQARRFHGRNIIRQTRGHRQRRNGRIPQDLQPMLRKPRSHRRQNRQSQNEISQGTSPNHQYSFIHRAIRVGHCDD